jgi:hypothetical protein
VIPPCEMRANELQQHFPGASTGVRFNTLLLRSTMRIVIRRLWTEYLR